MAADPHYASVSLLLHCDGPNGSTAFADTSPTPKTITALGDASVTTAQSMFGGACLAMPVEGSNLLVAAGEGCTFGADDFTVEMWVKTASAGVRYFMGQTTHYGDASWAMGLDGGKFFWIDTNPASDWFMVKGVVTVNDGQWHHVAAARAPGVLRLFVDGVADGDHAGTSAYSVVGPCGVGGTSDPWDASNTTIGHLDEVRVTKGVARYTGAFTPPAAAFDDGAIVAGATAMAAAASPMGAVQVFATAAPPAVVPMAIAQAPGPLGRAAITARHDFTGLLGDAVALFVMDLATPGGTVRIPISSWQATLQTGSSNYVQCVVPACTMWASAINSATEFVIYRRAELPSGTAIEYEMARAPTGQAQFDRGGERHTCTLSGYTDAFAASENPPAAYNRALAGVRSISSGSGYRVRCAVDWLLRPGHRAFVEGVPFIVKYINYYAPSGYDCYMDVGG